MPLIPVKPNRSPRKAAQSASTQVATLMAPTAGLNLRDPFLTLKPQDALVLNNFIARPQGCETRAGYRNHVTGLGGSVATLMSYMGLSPLDNKLFAAVGDKIFDVTDSAESPTPIVADSNSADGVWSYIMFSGPTQNYLCCTSPSGGYWTYDSLNGWVDRTANLTGFSGNPGAIAAWKNRLFITANETNKVYFLPVNSIQGAASEFDFGPLMKHGGSVVAITNWTLNAGIDIDDYFVVFGSMGDVLVYQGTDPADIATFAIKGIWYAGRPPKGNRFYHEYGGELFVLTELGLLPLSKMVNGLVADSYNVMSSRIQPALSAQFTTLINTPFWEVGLADSNDLLVIKVPKSTTVYSQWVMNIATGAWSTFTGLPINTWITYNGVMYIGDDDGNVHTALVGDKDGVAIDGTGGEGIRCIAQGGFNTFGLSANLKLFDMARPIFISSFPPAVAVQMNIDYLQNNIYANLSFVDSDEAFWDTAHWNDAEWVSGTDTYAAWAGLQGMGYYGSLRLAVQGKAGTSYISANVMYRPGGVM